MAGLKSFASMFSSKKSVASNSEVAVDKAKLLQGFLKTPEYFAYEGAVQNHMREFQSLQKVADGGFVDPVAMHGADQAVRKTLSLLHARLGQDGVDGADMHRFMEDLNFHATQAAEAAVKQRS